MLSRLAHSVRQLVMIDRRTPRRRLAAVLVGCLTPVAIGAQAAAWTTVTPGGKTRCAFDTPFQFWVREGEPAQVFLYLQGGGACWSFESCDPRGDRSFDSTIDSTDYQQRRDGIFDRSSTANPFRKQTAIFVPYCTGDLHLGARTVRYTASGDSGASVTVNHVGYYNVSAVLEYLAARPAAPRLITVVGASAGGVASPFVASEIARRFPGAEVRQIADGAGAFRVPRLRTLLTQWAVDSLMDALGTPLAPAGDLVVGFYRSAATRSPQVRFSQVGTTSDAVVGVWLRRFGDHPSHVSAYIADTYRELDAAGLCFTGYTLPGTDHTILWRPNALTTLISGVSLGQRIEREVLRPPCQPRKGPANVGASRDGVRRGQETPLGDAGDAAFLFMYRAKPDMDAAFAEGYRRHLGWHAAHADSLSWLAWTVIDGPAVGTFVDGTFGIAFKAFDDRVDPPGDGEDATRNVTAYATPTNRGVYRLRRDLSRSPRLESGQPGRMQRVTMLTVSPGSEPTIERVFRALASTKLVRSDFAVYERVSGGEQPTLMVVTQLDAWAGLDDTREDAVAAIVRAAGATLVRAESETWAYRSDLSYIPKR